VKLYGEAYFGSFKQLVLAEVTNRLIKP